MLDNLYENIGGKIKNWAKWIFIVEAIGAIITGLVLLFIDEDLILYGLLTLVCGTIVAWVGSWILYAFGELVEDVHAIRNKEETTQKYINHGIAPEYVGDGYTCPVCKMSMDALIPCEKCGYIPPQND